MTWYALLKFLHVLLAIVAVGANVTYGVWLSRAARDRRHLLFALRGVQVLDDRIANPAYVLVLVTGLAMLHAGGHAITTPWILSSLVLYVLVAVVGILGYSPVLRRQIAVLDTGGADSPEFVRLAAVSRRLGIVLAVLVVAIVFLMVTRPPLWGA
ncbi:MAG: DUF2269 family protein [Armatimonadota bacterium]|nr:DUF2269 family protein [Armatimonadota bacterium]